MALTIRPLHPSFGAEVTGADLGQFDGDIAGIVCAWRQYGLLVFRRQDLSPETQLDFSRILGGLDLAPNFDVERSALEGHPEIAVVSNIKIGSTPIGGLGDGELAWHSDMTYVPSPPIGCLLHARELPKSGGDTSFLDLRAAWRDLPEPLKQAASKARAFHDRAYTSAGTPRLDGQAGDGSWHPIRLDDPLSGQPILFLGRRRGSRATFADGSDGADLLTALWKEADTLPHIYRHIWQDGDALLWNNLAVLHCRDAFDSTERRLLYRTQIRRLEPRWQRKTALADAAPLYE
jgi:taurine dioxygenase